jgi:hypothetical protein
MSSDAISAELTRREVLAGATAAVAATVVAGCPRAALGARASRTVSGQAGGLHGGAAAQRGVDVAMAVGRDKEGRFGAMFKKLDAYAPSDAALVDLAHGMTDPGVPPSPNPVADPLGTPDLPAGFTFLGQFIDHDLTFDQTPLSDQQTDPHAVLNFESARLDLSSVYGKGPEGDPELYDERRPGVLRLDRREGLEDLPRRRDGSALIADPRNDENVIISQLHIAFIKLHNALVERSGSFADAQRLTRWHFQWVVTHDFLEHVVGRPTVDRFLTSSNGRIKCRRDHYAPKNPQRPMMPIEFAAAAYRFGHSMVRGGYLMNATHGAAMFSPTGPDLRGARPLTPAMKIDWREFFRMRGGPMPHNTARRIDTKLALPLHELPSTVVPSDIHPLIQNLAERNLLRGKRVGLPAGQDVATAMGIEPIANAQLGLNDPRLLGKAPLWFYVLAEADRNEKGERLGPVGGRIVAETILGILDHDRDSYFHERGWAPTPPVASAPGECRIGDLLDFANRN